MKVLSDLMIALIRHIKEKRWTQKEAAKLLGVSQPRISDLMRGKVDLFSVDAVVVMLIRAGYRVEIGLKEAA